MPPEDLRRAIAKSDLARDLPEAFIDGLAAIAQVRRIPEGAVILKEMDETFDLMLLIEGEGKVLTITDELITTIKEGSPLGEISFFDRKPRAAAVVAMRDSVVVVWPERELRALTDAHPEAALRALYNLAGVLCARLRRANQQIAALLAVEESSLV